ncbi:hypothetical protein C8N24_5543 [Solirubrobacter pauli]|uniref:Virginiamycin B lyase n=1 Tax=Solirubrobacter pauli TaxID=166793 RepID=A0A660L7G5_9ACTN|nr:hypothetical protein [Solirubrobacter pauli]RKQ87520.1 hypothetical protein C8N24_5543 [Solirubrobacter pauli]
MRAFCTIIALLALAAPAHAADLRVGLKSSVRQLIVGPDGGAWAHVSATRSSRVVRITPQGAQRSTRTSAYVGGGLGPDGRAWLLDGPDLLRIDGNGLATRTPVAAGYDELVTAPDGTAWVFDGENGARLAADGTAQPLDLAIPGCPKAYPHGLTRAADGAIWFYASHCGFVRVPPGGTPTVVANPDEAGTILAPDAHGGIWFSVHIGPGGGHVDTSGRVTLLKRPGHLGTRDVAVAPDGSAYYATGQCFLTRAAADGRVSRHPIAVPATLVDFDAAGGLWLATPSRVRHTTLDAPAAGCDDTPPTVRIVPDPAKPVSLAALRRQGGFKLTVGEPFQVEAYVFDGPGDYSFGHVYTSVTARGGRTVRMALDVDELRDLARQRDEPLALVGTVRDREGNEGGFEHELRLKP